MTTLLLALFARPSRCSGWRRLHNLAANAAGTGIIVRPLTPSSGSNSM
jgi:hypothetical protein